MLLSKEETMLNREDWMLKKIGKLAKKRPTALFEGSVEQAGRRFRLCVA